MAGIPLPSDSDGMSGIEPLDPGSSAEASPAPGERSASARSSTNTADLLASTLSNVDQVLDSDDFRKQEIPAQVGNPQSVQRQSGNTNLQWQDDDGQTVSSIFSPLSSEVSVGNPRSITKSGYGFTRAVTGGLVTPTEHTTHDVQTAGTLKGQSRALHFTLITPQDKSKRQEANTTSRSLMFQSGGELDGMNQTVLDRRRDFVSKFDSRGGTGSSSAHKGFRDGAHPLQHERTKVQLSPEYADDHLSVSDQLQLKDYEEQRLSADSTLTEHLLRGITPTSEHISPPYSVPYDSGLASNLQSLQTATKPHTISMRSESYLVQENLEKERYRRKHCELQIRDLHSRLMESQQLLAVAEATRRKKDTMIEQIEKNFSKVASDWKTKDKEKLESLDRLKRDCDKHQHIARMREQDLEVRERENADLRMAKEELQAELNQLREDTSSQLDESREKMRVTIREMEHAVQERVAAEQHVKKVQDMLAKERSEWREKEADFNKRLVGLEEEIGTKHEEFQRTLEKETEAAKRLISENDERRERTAQLQNELSKTLQEKESLSLEMSLKEAQFEASLQKQEIDWKEQMERLVQERTASVQEEAGQQIDRQTASHRAQIDDITERQREEVRRLREESESEMKARVARHRSTEGQLQAKLDQSNQEIIRLSSKLEEVQKHRSLMIQKLQTCLQSYATDSLMMLGQLNSSPATSTNQLTTQGSGVVTPKSSVQRHHQVSNGGRLSVDQQFLQLMTTLSSDVGYHSLSANIGPQTFHSHDSNRTAHQMADPHSMAPEVYDQPPPVRFDTVPPPSLSSERGILTERVPTEDEPPSGPGMNNGCMTNGGVPGGGYGGHWQEGWRSMGEDGGEMGTKGRHLNPRDGHFVGHTRAPVQQMRSDGGEMGHKQVITSSGHHDPAKRPSQHSQGWFPSGIQVMDGNSLGRVSPHPGPATHGAMVPQQREADISGARDSHGGQISEQEVYTGGDRQNFIPARRKYHYGEAETDPGMEASRRSNHPDNPSEVSRYQGGSQPQRDTSVVGKRAGYHTDAGNVNNSSMGYGSQSELPHLQGLNVSKRSDYHSEYGELKRQGDTSRRSDSSYSTHQESRLSHYEDRDIGNFQPLPETDDLSLSEHPLNTTGQSLGDISQRLGKEEDRRQLLQHYLKELLDQATIPEELKNLPNQLKAQGTSHTGHRLRHSTSLQGVEHQSGKRVQITKSSAPPAPPERQRPASNSPVQRDIVPVKERSVPRKEEPPKSGRSSGRSSAEGSTRSGQRLSDESRAGRRSANSSIQQGRSQPGKEQTAFGTSTPKKKGAPRSMKPPTRKVKPKPGVWK